MKLLSVNISDQRFRTLKKQDEHVFFTLRACFCAIPAFSNSGAQIKPENPLFTTPRTYVLHTLGKHTIIFVCLANSVKSEVAKP